MDITADYATTKFRLYLELVWYCLARLGYLSQDLAENILDNC